MMPQLGWVVAAFASGTGTVTLERAGAVTYSNGIATPGAVSNLSIEVLSMPQGRRLERLPEGDQTPDMREYFVTDAGIVIEGARASGSGAPRQPDVLIESGVRWVVVNVDDWTAAGYRRVICKREGE